MKTDRESIEKNIKMHGGFCRRDLAEMLDMPLGFVRIKIPSPGLRMGGNTVCAEYDEGFGPLADGYEVRAVEYRLDLGNQQIAQIVRAIAGYHGVAREARVEEGLTALRPAPVDRGTGSLEAEYKAYCEMLYKGWEHENPMPRHEKFPWNVDWVFDKAEEWTADWKAFITPLAEAWWRERGYRLIWPAYGRGPCDLKPL
jgi:hypothetical protein